MRPVLKGSTDQSVVIRIIDSADGTPEQAVEHNTSGIALWYRREGGTKATITPAALTALDDAHSDGGIEHIDDGYYRLDVPDAAFASGADGVMVGGAVTDMIVIGVYVPLVAFNPQDGVRAGLTALPNAAADAAGGLPISDAGGLDLDAQVGTKINSILADTGTDGVVVAPASKTGYTISGTITTLDALDTAQDSQHAQTQSDIAALPTAAENRAEMDSNSTQLAAIVADTNELQTDWANGGRLDLIIDAILTDTGTTLDGKLDTIDGIVDQILADTGTDGVAISATVANKIADHVLRRTFANAAASSDGDAKAFRSMLGAMAKLVNKVAISGSTLTVYEADDTTSLGTQAVTTDANADPITAVDTA